MDNHSNLVKIYMLVCDAYENELKYCVQRFSNNNQPRFTDQEVLTIMLYCTGYERRLTIRGVYNFTSDWLGSWFPLLPSYPAFVMRVNRLSEAFRRLLSIMLRDYSPDGKSESFCMVDSMPVITCSAKRNGKVAREVTDKGYCSTKSLYYYGVKLHLFSVRVKGTLPHPEALVVTPASESDLSVFRENWSSVDDKVVFADKAYIDRGMQQSMAQNNSEVLTPVKYTRGVPECIKQRFKAADDLLSRAVSSIRQPIESLFSWLLEKSDIQRASKVRSTNGLFVHIFAKLTAVLCAKLVFNS
jgi:Transposase DDE domain.